MQCFPLRCGGRGDETGFYISSVQSFLDTGTEVNLRFCCII